MSTAHPPETAALDPPYVQEVSDGIFAYIQPDGTWFLNNTGWIAGDDGVIVVDSTGTEKRAYAFYQALQGTTALPAKALVNTHSHGDHTNGNFVFAPQTAIIAHDLCREEVKAANLQAIAAAFPGGDFGNPAIVPPFVTFSDRLNVFAGDVRIELIYVGPAHTTNDVLAWIPERRVLFSGDIVFNGGTPFAVGGSVAGWLEALETIRALNPAVIVPGHGAVCDLEVTATIEAYLQFLEATARIGLKEGLEPLALARQIDLGEFAALTDPERIVGNLHRAYSELQGNPRGAPLNIRGVIGEMVAYNGGQPLRCLA
jgi:cyclase